MSRYHLSSPHNMSPHVTAVRTVHVGATVPSSRVAGGQLHDDEQSHHHRSNSHAEEDTVDLLSLAQLRDHTRRRSSIGSDDGAFLDTGSPREQKQTPVEEEDDATKASSRAAWRQQQQRRERAQTPSESDSSDSQEDEEANAAASPSQQSACSTPSMTPNADRKEGRLLIVANRLPLSMKTTKKKDANGKEVNDISFSSSSGGLVSALAGCQMESVWIGWPGAEVKRSADRESVRRKLDDQNCVPVFLTQKVADPFYNGFCNNVLWPLFHYLPLPVESITTVDAQFEAYKVANQQFADVVLRTYQAGDVVWVHDYHLLLLPHILRAKVPDMKIGFFFHTPFPASEIYRVMPARKELLAGVLSANFIGFHTPDYQRHFLESCVRILGAKAEGDDSLVYHGLTSKLRAVPIGIDPQRFIASVETEKTREYMEQYRKEFNGKKVFLGIDRLDYIKGIQHKIYALERLFERHPELTKEVVFVQIAVPSRTDVVEYQRLKAATHKLVGRVNGLYGGVGSTPIHYLDQSIPFDRMCALYRISDAMVITSVRDGMNLVAYEYIACQRDMEGTLILSEFAGAAKSLEGGALSVNPWSVNEVAEAMYQSITMSEEERKRRNNIMFKYVTTQTSSAWARQFLRALLETTNTPLTWLKGMAAAAAGEDVASASASPNEPTVAPAPETWDAKKASSAVQPVSSKTLGDAPAGEARSQAIRSK